MRTQTLLSMPALAIGAAVYLGAAGAAQACDGYPAAQAALAADDMARLSEAHASMVQDVSCGQLTPFVGRVLAAKRQDHIMNDPSLSPSEQAEALEAALETGQPWQVLAARGYLAFEQKDYDTAKKFLTEALVDASSLTSFDRHAGMAPTTEQRDHLVARHEEALLLSQSMDGARSRGACFIRARSAFTVAPAAVPIRFDTDSAEIKGDAAQDAKALLECLSETEIAGLVLVGHTDERGDAAYNDRLSLDRAMSVRDWLRANGLPAHIDIEVEGAGEREPYQPTDPSRFSTSERWALDRRVVIRTKDR